MAITKTKRTEETRESTSKIETSSFEEENYLDIPQSVKDKFNSQGMTLRWVRICLLYTSPSPRDS